MTQSTPNLDRRTFLHPRCRPGRGLAGHFRPGGAGQEPRRHSATSPLGRTGEKVTMIGLGGFHAAVPEPESDSLRLIQRTVDEGITFLDNAWDYMDGKAEDRMGKAISQGGRRDKKIFLMTKCCGRTAKDAQSNLEDSLRRLRTDHLDLWQFHEINYDNDPNWVFDRRTPWSSPSRPGSKARSAILGSPATSIPRFTSRCLRSPTIGSASRCP